MAIVTDLGHLPADLLQALRGCHYYVFEANHDELLERQSNRPWSLKLRVLGDHGHLSNNQAAEGLVQLADGAKGIWLAHLSEECNQPELATAVVRKRLLQAGLTVPVSHLPAREMSPFLGDLFMPKVHQLQLAAEES